MILCRKQIRNKLITRAISEFDEKNIIAMQRFLEFCDLRHVSPLNIVPLVLIDGKEALICLNGNNQGIPENAIWTNHPEFVNMLAGYFNLLWGNAQDGKTMVEQFKQLHYGSV